MNARRSTKIVVFVLTLLAGLAVGCAGPTFVVQQYDGPPRPRELIAVIRVNGSDPIVWDSLDGEDTSAKVAEDARLHVEVLPGEHTLRLRSLYDLSQIPDRVSFRAEAGKVYRPVFQLLRQAERPELAPLLKARVYEVDSASDALIRDVTLPPHGSTETYPPSGARPRALRKAPTPAVVHERAQDDAGPNSDAAPRSLAGDAGVPAAP